MTEGLDGRDESNSDVHDEFHDGAGISRRVFILMCLGRADGMMTEFHWWLKLIDGAIRRAECSFHWWLRLFDGR